MIDMIISNLHSDDYSVVIVDNIIIILLSMFLTKHYKQSKSHPCSKQT